MKFKIDVKKFNELIGKKIQKIENEFDEDITLILEDGTMLEI